MAQRRRSLSQNHRTRRKTEARRTRHQNQPRFALTFQHQNTPGPTHRRRRANRLRNLSRQSIHPERAFEILAQTYALHTMAGPDLDHAAFQHITRFLLRQEDQRIRQRALDLKQKRLAFDMQWKHYDIFKRTIEKLPEINEIIRDEQLSPAEKFHRHFVKTFGGSVADMVSHANEKWAEEHPEQAAHTQPDYNQNDVTTPLTEAEQQAADTEAIDVLMGWKNGKNDDEPHSAGPAKKPKHKPLGAQPDTTDQTYPL